jgi:hypothetical protein
MPGKPRTRAPGRQLAVGSQRTGFQRRLELVAESRACGFGSWGALHRALVLALRDPDAAPLNPRDLGVEARAVESTVRRWREVGAGPPGQRLLDALVRATKLPVVWWLYGAGPNQGSSLSGLADEQRFLIGSRDDDGEVAWLYLGALGSEPSEGQLIMLELANSDTLTTTERRALARWLRVRRRLTVVLGSEPDALLLEGAAARNPALAEPSSYASRPPRPYRYGR